MTQKDFEWAREAGQKQRENDLERERAAQQAAEARAAFTRAFDAGIDQLMKQIEVILKAVADAYNTGASRESITVTVLAGGALLFKNSARADSTATFIPDRDQRSLNVPMSLRSAHGMGTSMTTRSGNVKVGADGTLTLGNSDIGEAVRAIVKDIL